jgi:hypothetical protein
MTRFHATSNGNVPFTAQEETDRDAEEAAAALSKPMDDWSQAMQENDHVLPRYVEDVYDGMNPSDQANVSQVTKDKVAAKKTLRGQRP